MTEPIEQTTNPALPRGHAAARSRGRHHERPARTQRINLRLDDDEAARVAAAAARVGLTPAGFCAEAALGAASTGQIQGAEAAREELCEVVAEMFAARTAVNRFGNNVNQAVAGLHSTGAAPVWLADATALCTRAVADLDDAVRRIIRLLPRLRPR